MTTACSEQERRKVHALNCPADLNLSDCALHAWRPVADAGNQAS
jgi:hypothetical protein